MIAFPWSFLPWTTPSDRGAGDLARLLRAAGADAGAEPRAARRDDHRGRSRVQPRRRRREPRPDARAAGRAAHGRRPLPRPQQQHPGRPAAPRLPGRPLGRAAVAAAGERLLGGRRPDRASARSSRSRPRCARSRGDRRAGDHGEEIANGGGVEPPHAASCRARAHCRRRRTERPPAARSRRRSRRVLRPRTTSSLPFGNTVRQPRRFDAGSCGSSAPASSSTGTSERTRRLGAGRHDAAWDGAAGPGEELGARQRDLREVAAGARRAAPRGVVAGPRLAALDLQRHDELGSGVEIGADPVDVRPRQRGVVAAGCAMDGLGNQRGTVGIQRERVHGRRDGVGVELDLAPVGRRLPRPAGEQGRELGARVRERAPAEGSGGAAGELGVESTLRVRRRSARRRARRAATRRRAPASAPTSDAGAGRSGRRSRRTSRRTGRSGRSRARGAPLRCRPSPARSCSAAPRAPMRAKQRWTYAATAAMSSTRTLACGQRSGCEPPVPRWSTKTMSRVAAIFPNSWSNSGSSSLAAPPGPALQIEERAVGRLPGGREHRDPQRDPAAVGVLRDPPGTLSRPQRAATSRTAHGVSRTELCRGAVPSTREHGDRRAHRRRQHERSDGRPARSARSASRARRSPGAAAREAPTERRRAYRPLR